WVALTLLAIWPGIDGPFTRHWWIYYGFLQVLSPKYAGGGIPQAWSLCVEVAFYVSLPVIAFSVRRMVMRRGRWRPRIDVVVLGSVILVNQVWFVLTRADVFPAHWLPGWSYIQSADCLAL